MKKFLIPVLAFAAFLFVACSKPTPGEEAISLLEEATEKVENAKDIAELESLGNDFEAKFGELEKKYPDYKPSGDEEKRVNEAMEKFQDACQKKAMEFVGDMLGGEGGEEESED